MGSNIITNNGIAGGSHKADVRRGCSTRADAQAAVDELAEQLEGPNLNSVIFFCGPEYDLEALAKAVDRRFSCPVIGCTTAGELFSPWGYLQNSLTGIGFASPDISMTPYCISRLTDFLSGKQPSGLESLPPAASGRRFALMLIDGLSLLEERVASAVQSYLRDIPFVGGSAGDGLNFGKTHVYCNGSFRSNAAVVALFETSLPFKIFRAQHFVPSQTKLVITETDTEARTVFEINGLPAAEEYARAVGVPVSKFSPSVFAANPVMVSIGGEYFVRSIARLNPDQSLTFFCAIDSGLVLTLARGVDLLDNLKHHLDLLSQEIPDMSLVLGFDCILRRIEVEGLGEEKAIQEVMTSFPVAGFSTYGEQYNGIHVNQTLTGLALGGLRV